MSNKLPRGTLDRLWSDPDNWIGLGIYYCKDDPRVIVPKRMKSLGWSMNFANPWVWPAIVFVVVSASLPVVYLKVYNAPVVAALFIALWVVALVLVCRAMSTTEKFED
jgi:Family of unknown function (DUF5808)